jgi:hypothetical protein
MGGADDQGGLRPAATTIDAAALDRACFGFHRAAPARSAKRVLFWTQIAVLCALGWALYGAIRHNSALTQQVGLWIAYGLFAAATAWRLYAAANLTPVLSRVGEPRDGVWPTYTLLCPLYREAGIVFDLAAALDQLDYPGTLH